MSISKTSARISIIRSAPRSCSRCWIRSGLTENLGIWLEGATLIIPGYSDDEEDLKEIADLIVNLGTEIPWPLSIFYPTYELRDAPRTPAKTLRRARQIGIDAGLHYVYEGKIPGEEGENTYYYAGAELLIERSGFSIRQNLD